MSFVVIKTAKGETVCVNCGKILFFCDSKKGSSIFMEDGTMFEMNVPLPQLLDEVKEHFTIDTDSK